MVAALSVAYGLPPLLRFAKNVPATNRLTLEDQATVFEAAVGAVHREYGYDTVKEWLYALLDWDNVYVARCWYNDVLIHSFGYMLLELCCNGSVVSEVKLGNWELVLVTMTRTASGWCVRPTSVCDTASAWVSQLSCPTFRCSLILHQAAPKVLGSIEK